MKKHLLWCILILFIGYSLQNVHAINSDPAGKNILNPAKFSVSDGYMETIEPIEVIPNTNYVFTMPSYSLISDVNINIYSQSTVYIDELTYSYTECELLDQRVSCPFQTDATTTELQFAFTGGMIDTYIDYYGFTYFQLEQGNYATTYEPYQGIVDSEYQGTGTLYTSYETNLSLPTIINEYISAYDEIDGDVSQSITVSEDSYTGQEQIVGTYQVRFDVSDTSANAAHVFLNIVVTDHVAPVIEGPTQVSVCVNQQMALADIIEAHYIFFDDHDGIITSYQLLENEYSTNQDIPGEYQVTIAIEDSSENQTTKTFMVEVTDEEAPSIIGPDSLSLYMSHQPTFADILAEYTVTDNVTPSDEIDFSIDSHNLPEEFDEPGSFSLTLAAIDCSNNTTYKEIIITIIDDIPPVIEGPSQFETSYQSVITLEDILNTLTVEDNVANLSVADINVDSNDYHPHATVPGEYEIILSVSDGYNTTLHVITIHVIDDVPPQFYFDARIIIEEGTVLTLSSLYRGIADLDHIMAFNPISVSWVEEPEFDRLEPGEYVYALRLQNNAGETMIEQVEIVVIEPIEEDSPMVQLTWYVAITGLIMSLGILAIKRFRA